MPFYKRIGMDMPKQLESITADKLCEILGVTNLHIPDRADDKSSTSKSDSGSIWILCLVFFVIVIILSLLL